MSRRVIYLIRNGEYNRDDVDDDFNAPLTERGIQQAQRTARALKDLPISTIYTSPHEQTGTTADIIRQSIPNASFHASDDLKQYPSANINKTFTREMMELAFQNNHKPQIETAFERFFQPAEDTDIHEVLVCHGNIVLDLVCFATGVNSETWSHMLINNCAINIVSIESAEDIQLVAFNDVRHLPENMRTG